MSKSSAGSESDSDTVISTLRDRLQSHTTPELAERAADLVDALLGLSPHLQAPADGRSPGAEPPAYPGADFENHHQWYGTFENLLLQYSEQTGQQALMRFRHAFPPAYTERFSCQQALDDIRFLESLSADHPLCMGFYTTDEALSGAELADGDCLTFKLYSNARQPVLSEVIPVLENLGLRVLSEHPHQLRASNQQVFWVSDFRVQTGLLNSELSLDTKRLVEETFVRVWSGEAENDRFNRLGVAGSLNWRDVTLLRACARYMKQLKFGFSQNFLADVLARNLSITQALVALFHTRFDPDYVAEDGSLASLEQHLDTVLEQVETLDDDRILRRFREVISAIVRTNAYQYSEDGESREGFKSYWSFKLRPDAISGIPQPVPAHEIFVYSPAMEGVHLRTGKVARGGLRWSDRQEDYRTEVLGLVKAQQVKNSVIVPAGAKGCFVCKQLPVNGGREAVQAEGVRCYQMFIRGLLDVTDNLVNGELVHPPRTRLHDERDEYLVVAADKGTATFSDIANRIAAEYNFWLGDAFASGGSEGYDHKGIGITARGAWESVKRHFREQGTDVEHDPVSVLGIGDMSGDVFGNGLLLSQSLRLVAAFNHQHIFIDPNPDPLVSWAERKRLFELPRSSWADYRKETLSAGGEVFSRSAKWLRLTPEIQQRFGIEASRMSPGELIQVLLQSEVDLIWNGGIGTWVKAQAESHADVGDKANDGWRADGQQLRARVIGEGGNLGITQAGRVAFSLAGGRCNTDFVDNAGGVDCSDHEVNIKILLNPLVAGGEITMEERNQLLRDMTDDVARLVLKNNYRQAQAISLARQFSLQNLQDYLGLMRDMAERGLLNTRLEHLPDLKEMTRRQDDGGGFTRPELSVLICYVRMELKQALAASWVTDQPEFQIEMDAVFPDRLCEQYGQLMPSHPLRREIIATQIANDLVNRAGMTLVHQANQNTGADASQVAAAWLIVQRLFNLNHYWSEIEALDGKVTWATQAEMIGSLKQMIDRAIPWVLRHFPGGLPASDGEPVVEGKIDAFVGHYQSLLAETMASEGSLARLVPESRWQDDYSRWTDAGVPSRLALFCSASESLYWLLDVIGIGQQTDTGLAEAASVYFGLGSRLQLTWLDQQLRRFSSSDRWQRLAVKGYRQELDSKLRQLACKMLMANSAAMTSQQNAVDGPETAAGTPCLETTDIDLTDSGWLNQLALKRWQSTLADIQGSARHDSAAYSVALTVLGDLAG